jgi:DNA-binding CsgD family transcriptional regulator
MGDELGRIRGAEQRLLQQLILPGPHVHVVTVRGEAGIGKTTLLAGVADAAAGAGWRVLRASGSTSEAKLSLAGLHQLLRPLLSAVDDLPPAQRATVNSAFGLARGSGPAHLLQLYIACLTLLSQQSEHAPLLLVVDDAQWIDQATRDILAFIARRLADDPIAIIFGSREAVSADLGPDSRTIDLSPLAVQEANHLLDLLPQPPKGEARAAILAQAGGNPLGLVELTRAAAANPGAAADWHRGALALTDRLRQSFTASARSLPEQTQHALLLAAADDNTELNLSYLSGLLGVTADAWPPAQAAGLITISDGSAVFSHPLIRSAIYQSASPAARVGAHRALAAALQQQPQRQAWHLAAATTGPDEALAKRLESIAEEAGALGRFEEAATAWQRAAEFSLDRPAAARLLAMAATATGWIGQVERAASLASRALALTTESAVRGRAHVVLGYVLSLTFEHGRTVDLISDLVPELAGTADLLWASVNYAAKAAYYSGDDALCERVLVMLGRLNGGLPAWQAAVGSEADVRASALWCGTAVRPLTDRSAKLAAIRELTSQVSPRQYLPLAAAAMLADDPRRAVVLRSQAGDTPELLGRGTVLMIITWSLLETGQWDDALEYSGRARALTAIYHDPVVDASVTTAAAYIAACRGNCSAAADDAMSVLGISGLTARSSVTARANHAMGMTALVQDRNDEAFDWLCQLAADGGQGTHYREALFGLIDLAEAARRTGRQPEASRLVEAALSGVQGELSPRLLQVHALCRALLADGTAAEAHFLEALSVIDGDHVPFERARVRLSYGQWLRRERRHKDARRHLNAAAHVFRRLAATPWLNAATHEQRAAGVRSDFSTADQLSSLSPSERQVVLLAAEGLTNPEIAARLFVSPRTVGAHLYRSFSKLGVSNRTQLTGFTRPART